MERQAAEILANVVLGPEQFSEAIRSSQLDPCQLSAAAAPSWMGRVVMPRTCLDFAEIGPPMLFTGAMPTEHYTMVFVTKCPQSGRSFNFGVEHQEGYMGFFPPGGQLDAYTPEGYANATLTVPVPAFHEALEQFFPEIPDRILKHGAGMRIGPEAQGRLRLLLSALREAIRNPAGPMSAMPQQGELERLLTEAFLGALRSGAGNLVPLPKVRIASRLRRLRQARDFIHANAHEPIRLDRLGMELGMSQRGLEVLFQDSLGIGPSAFIRCQRLHGVRRELLAAEAMAGGVKTLALKWGFWHLGHFSRNYRSLFGENPSATLLRS